MSLPILHLPQKKTRGFNWPTSKTCKILRQAEAFSQAEAWAAMVNSKWEDLCDKRIEVLKNQANVYGCFQK